MSDYADTSFLVSLYVLDGNSTPAAARMKKASFPLVLNSFGEIELINAISLRQFRREISASNAKASLTLMRKDIEGGVLSIVPISTAMVERAKQIARKRTPRLGTRTLDILHVSSARVLQCRMFFTFDARQEKLARSEGLAVR